MKVAAAILVILALAIAIVPQYTDCHSQGRALTLEDGRQIPMKCHWTAQAELGLGLPILAVGALVFGSRRKESLRNLGFLGIALGAITVVLPTNLIGVCGNPDMICNSTMKPALVFMGILVSGISLGVVVQSLRKEPEVL
jgi:hypothetical protein